MRNLRYEFLEWAVGSFCFVVGVMMLIVPHQFNTPSYRVLQPTLALWGILFLSAGGLLLLVAVFKPQRILVIAAHLFAGALLLLIAAGFAQVGALSGITHYTVLGLGTLLTPLMTFTRKREEAHSSDLFGIVMSIAAIVTGSMILVIPDQYNLTLVASIRHLIPGFGIAFFAAGLFTLIVLVYPKSPSIVCKIAYAVLGVTYVLWFLQMALPIRALTGYPYYGGMGLLLIFSPWLQERAYNLSRDSLRVRFALSLAVLAAIPMILLAYVVTEQQRQSALDQALHNQENFATAQGQYINSIISLYRAAADSLAAQPGLMQMSQEEQENLTVAFKEAYPDALLFSVRDASNNILARSDRIKSVNNSPNDPLYEKVKTTNQTGMRVGFGQVYQRMLLVMASPIHDEQGQFSGMAILTVDTSRLNNLLDHVIANGEDLVYVVDEQGHVIIHPDDMLVQASADYSQVVPVANMLASDTSAGSLIYTLPGSDARLAGYARVPDWGWGVVADRSVESSLTAVRAGRELALFMLIMLSLSALVIGAILSQSLTAPLSKVVRAMNQLPRGGSQPPLLSNGIAEVRLLINAFNDMQDRLMHRTQERDRAETRLAFLAEATDVLNASLNFEETLRAVARMAVSTIGDWCTIDLVDENNDLQQVAVAHNDPETEALVRDWRREILKAPRDYDMGREVLRTGEPILISEIPASVVEAVTTGDISSRKLLEALKLISALCVPLTVRDQRIGVIFLNTSQDSGRQLGQDDLVLVRELARRASTAIDNARLYREAQQAIQLRDEFLSVAAHELKTPITSVRGFAQMVVRQFEHDSAPDPSRLQLSLKRIDQQSEKLGRLVTQLLDVSRIMAGKLAIDPRLVDVVNLVKGVVDGAQITAQQQTIQHTIQLSAPPELRIKADPLRLEQVITNLVDNAIKYSPNGGAIDIEIAEVPQGTLSISVRDHGIGVPPVYRDQIFNRFFQAHRDRHYGGMGLGLYISRQIIELHGGQLEAEYLAEGGTRFVISLPIVETVPTAPPVLH